MPVDANQDNQIGQSTQLGAAQDPGYLDYQSDALVICRVSLDQTWPGEHLDPPFKDTTSLNFAFVNLEDGIQESAVPNWSETQVVGRAESFVSYTGGTNREIPLTFRFHAQMGAPEQGNAQALTGAGPVPEVVYPARWLDALQQNVVRNGLAYAPPSLILQIGDLLLTRCVMQSANITWESPFEPATMLPHGASVECTFKVTRIAVRNGTPPGGLAGMNNHTTIYG